MASPRQSGSGRPHATSSLALAALSALTSLAAFACDEAGRTEFAATPATLSCDARACATRVRIELEAPLSSSPGSGPLTFRLCFDGSCNDLALRGHARSLACEAVGERPLDQVAFCETRAGGVTTFEIVRTDDHHDDGARHVVALSARDAAGSLLLTAAAEVSLEPIYANGPACGVTCAQANVRFSVD
ncbi:MAG: hypothetical protein MUF34_03070 [Polyangiaceae bacterium]|nr:hypothetical protein [Polyangiaceae bacterium]